MSNLTYDDAIAFVRQLAEEQHAMAEKVKTPALLSAFRSVAAQSDDIASFLETKKRLHQGDPDTRPSATEADR
jgi:hypothetical protein